MPADPRRLSIAAPTLATRAAIWQLAHETDNSNAYLLWCSDYFDQSLIAWINGRLAGFVIAGELRSGSDTARIVDVAVSASYPRDRIVSGLLDQLVGGLRRRGVSYVEATLKSGGTELVTDLRSLAQRWNTTAVTAGPTDPTSAHPLTCTVGPIQRNPGPGEESNRSHFRT